MKLNNNYPLFCQFCGSNNLSKMIEDTASRCNNCQMVSYLNSKPSVCAVIIQEGRVILVCDLISPMSKWDLPGGFLLYGENPEAGLRRELKEELNVDIVI